MQDLNDQGKSVRLFRLMQNAQSIDDRLPFFEQLLDLDRGFWYPHKRLTLRAFMLIVARAAKAQATARGARRDAIDEESLAHDVLMAFFYQAAQIEQPRAWLTSTARLLLHRRLGAEWPVYYGREFDAPHPPAVFAPKHAGDARRDDVRMLQVKQVMATCLTATQRKTLDLYLAGKTSTGIGEILGMKPATVRKHISRALARLARALRRDVQIAADKSSQRR